MASAVPGISVTFTQPTLNNPAAIQGSPMTPQDQALLEAKMDAKVADIRSDVRLNTAGLTALTTRFDDLASRLTDVPRAVGVLEERVKHLPTTGKMVAFGLGALGFLTALITYSEKIHALIK